MAAAPMEEPRAALAGQEQPTEVVVAALVVVLTA
jgi:hypothetical protein